jgi:hypothetical protein
MSLSHHSWRSSRDTPPVIADSAQKPTGHDGFRTHSMITTLAAAEFCGGVASRPRLGGTPVLDERVPVGCPRDWLWSRFPPPSPQIAQDHREWYTSRTHAVYVPHPLIKEAVRGPALALLFRNLSDGPSARRKRDHRQSRGTRQSRSRPEQACPPAGDGRQRNHGIRQSRPPGHLRTQGVVASGWTAREAGPVREAARPEPGTARQAGFP